MDSSTDSDTEENIPHTSQIIRSLRVAIHKHIRRLNLQGVAGSRQKVEILLPMAMVLLGPGFVTTISGDQEVYPLAADANPITTLSRADFGTLDVHLKNFKKKFPDWPPDETLSCADRDLAMRVLVVLKNRVTELTSGNVMEEGKILLPFFLMTQQPEEVVDGDFDEDMYPKEDGVAVRWLLHEEEKAQALEEFETEWQDSLQAYETHMTELANNAAKMRNVVQQLRRAVRWNLDLYNPVHNFHRLRMLVGFLTPMALFFLPGTELEVLKSFYLNPMYPRTDDDNVAMIRTLTQVDIDGVRPYILQFRQTVSAGNLWHSRKQPLPIPPPRTRALDALLDLSERLELFVKEGPNTAQRRKELMLPFFIWMADDEVQNFPENLYPRDPQSGAPIRRLSAQERIIARGVFEEYYNPYRLLYNELAVRIRTGELMRDRVRGP